MRRNRIVDHRLDLAILQITAKQLPIRRSDYIQMPDWLASGNTPWENESAVRQSALIETRNLGASCIFSVQMGQLGAQKSGLQFVQTRVEALDLVLVLDA